MDTYSFLRELADSWVLLAMFAFFAGAAVWAFWPGLSHAREDASMIPFRNDTAEKSCTNDCAACKCGDEWKDKFNV
ncbi:cytochrome c oxidase cbb3-type subunit 4 [Loktanella sp. DSM 29012]|uniref:CcoQ/FixQ family Cbb3-type cytochrome c oxidase assembly chaperone n=1 Tax=Loktanella gaetbuli TaxID=2881335 RepID=A0ABS8BZA0_9RHOB|nr:MULTISPECIES: CcoQ/FixQ family Cbb3-type cytochrome c oxidase assembly chaperone [Loktanella]MCB5200781.1 CcoQ/FixQ family Cbb3-type cytochrome c oxidase assembly chaperone [Loktanella gaetbuli]SEQ46896.1 cytochrome c oxidase cbb3-type subunit 4 [Loktanella sp. DSM 29012]